MAKRPVSYLFRRKRSNVPVLILYIGIVELGLKIADHALSVSVAEDLPFLDLFRRQPLSPVLGAEFVYPSYEFFQQYYLPDRQDIMATIVSHPAGKSFPGS